MPALAMPLRGLPTASRTYDPAAARTGQVLDVLGGVAYLEDVETGERWTRQATLLRPAGETGPGAA